MLTIFTDCIISGTSSSGVVPPSRPFFSSFFLLDAVTLVVLMVAPQLVGRVSLFAGAKSVGGRACGAGAICAWAHEECERVTKHGF